MPSKLNALYIRVSTNKQNTGEQSQLQALQTYCDNHQLRNIKVYKDVISGSKISRSGLDQLKKACFMGKIQRVIVWKLDRLSRNLKDGINLLYEFLEQGIEVVSIQQQIKLDTMSGKIVASVLFALAEAEREQIRSNVKRGIATAKAKGVRLGPPNKTSLQSILGLQEQGKNVSQIAKQLGITRQTVYNYLAQTPVK